MNYPILIGLFILGMIFGSFGSVVLTRFSEEISWDTLKSFLFGKSKCPKCHNILGARNLIPIISYVWQKGKCQYCGKKISFVYPLLEILSGLVFVLTYLIGSYWGNLGNTEILFWMIINRGFLLLIFQDFLHYELHFFAWTIILAVSLFFQFFGLAGDYKWAFFGSVFFGVIYYLIYFLSNKYAALRYDKPDGGFGIGDVYFAFFVGTLISFVFQYTSLTASFPNIFVFILLFVIVSSLVGLIYGLFAYVLKTDKGGFMKLRIPFIPSMIFALWTLLLFGEYLYKLLFF